MHNAAGTHHVAVILRAALSNLPVAGIVAEGGLYSQAAAYALT